jgi:hypothetical protein
MTVPIMTELILIEETSDENTGEEGWQLCHLLYGGLEMGVMHRKGVNDEDSMDLVKVDLPNV